MSNNQNNDTVMPDLRHGYWTHFHEAVKTRIALYQHPRIHLSTDACASAIRDMVSKLRANTDPSARVLLTNVIGIMYDELQTRIKQGSVPNIVQWDTCTDNHVRSILSLAPLMLLNPDHYVQETLCLMHCHAQGYDALYSCPHVMEDVVASLVNKMYSAHDALSAEHQARIVRCANELSTVPLYSKIVNELDRIYPHIRNVDRTSALEKQMRIEVLSEASTRRSLEHCPAACANTYVGLYARLTHDMNQTQDMHPAQHRAIICHMALIAYCARSNVALSKALACMGHGSKQVRETVDNLLEQNKINRVQHLLYLDIRSKALVASMGTADPDMLTTMVQDLVQYYEPYSEDVKEANAAQQKLYYGAMDRLRTVPGTALFIDRLIP